MADNKNKSIGACWIKESKNGNTFMSGSVEIAGEKHQIVIFKNTHKTAGSNQPDYKIYPSTMPKNTPKIITEPDISDEEMPF